MRLPARLRPLLVVTVLLCALLAGGAVRRVQDTCGPFTDVSPLFCPYVLEAYYTGITAGTSPTTFSPDIPIARGQAAVFVTKGLNQALARSSRRAALGQWWTTTPHWDLGLGVTTVDPYADFPASDGADIWVPSEGGTVARVRASDGKLLETWTGANEASAICIAMGRVFIGGATAHGTLYMIDPSTAVGNVTVAADNLGGNLGGGTRSVAFDGSRLWTAQSGTNSFPPPPPNSIAIVTPGTWSVQTITAGFSAPFGLVYDGSSMWVTDSSGLLRLDSSGAVVQTVPILAGGFPVFDGTNIWVPGQPSGNPTVAVVRASSGDVVASLTGNGLTAPFSAAFDGTRVLVVNYDGGLSIWNAQNLSPVTNFPAAFPNAWGACSDGDNFWITFTGNGGTAGYLGRF